MSGIQFTLRFWTLPCTHLADTCPYCGDPECAGMKTLEDTLLRAWGRGVTGRATESFLEEDIWAIGEHIAGGSVDPHRPLAAASRTAGTFHNF